VNPIAFVLELRRSRALLFWLAIITAAYAGFITYFYSNVAENAEQWEKLLAIYPKEILVAFGFEGNFADPGIFLGGYLFSLLWPLIAAIAAIALASRIAADADRGFLDTALATPITRTRYLLSSIGVQLLGLATLAIVMIGAILGADLLIKPDFQAANVALASLHSIAFGIAVAGPATLLAVVLLDRGRAAGLVAGALIVMYLLNVIAALAPDYKALADVSYFHYFDLKALVSKGTYPLTDSLLFLVIGLAGWSLAIVTFRRRDLAA
jgi:ABC-2 type transport system permease protein